MSTPDFSFAADAAPNADKGEKHGAGEKHSKPNKDSDKLDLFKGWLDLTVWTIVVFLVLFTVLSLFVWPQVREGLDKRERSIAADKAEAVAAKKEAEALRVSLQAELAKANEQIRTMIDKARLDAESAAAEQLAKGKADLAGERERMLREVRLSSDAALKEIWQQAAELATLISSKAVRKQLSLDDHRALIDEALTEFRAAAQSRRDDIVSARA
jgi:F-type H+-transporting ATPase subunit b